MKNIIIILVAFMGICFGIDNSEAFPSSIQGIGNVSDLSGTALTIICGSAPEFEQATAMIPTLSEQLDESTFQSGIVQEVLSTGLAAPETMAVPEPSTVVLVGIGMIGLIYFNRRKRHSS